MKPLIKYPTRQPIIIRAIAKRRKLKLLFFIYANDTDHFDTMAESTYTRGRFPAEVIDNIFSFLHSKTISWEEDGFIKTAWESSPGETVLRITQTPIHGGLGAYAIIDMSVGLPVKLRNCSPSEDLIIKSVTIQGYRESEYGNQSMQIYSSSGHIIYDTMVPYEDARIFGALYEAFDSGISRLSRFKFIRSMLNIAGLEGERAHWYTQLVCGVSDEIARLKSSV